MTMHLDIAANRKSRKWTRKELAGRLAWGLLAGPLFAWTPRPMWGWRCAVLRLFGARIGRNVHISPSVRITIPWNLDIDDFSAAGDRAIFYALGPIRVGKCVTISQGAHICAGSHDWRSPKMTLIKPPITIGDDAWICADAFVGPGVTIGERAILGARGVAMRDLPAGVIATGNPAVVVSHRNGACK